jgi:hypothetical protein
MATRDSRIPYNNNNNNNKDTMSSCTLMLRQHL